MNEQTVGLVAGLLAEALVAGISYKQIHDAVKATGRVPPEMWADIARDVASAGEVWDKAPG